MNFTINLFSGFLGLLFRVLLAAAIKKDCLSRGIVKKNTYVALAFVFPIAAGIVYACTRNKAKKIRMRDSDFEDNKSGQEAVDYSPVITDDDKISSLIKSSKKLFIWSVIIFILYMAAAFLSPAPDKNDMTTRTYDIIQYDRNGDVYFFNQRVKYFDKDGTAYVLSENRDCFVNTQTGEEFVCYSCFVDKDGYLLCFNPESFFDDYFEEPYYQGIGFCYSDAQGNLYYKASAVRWDRKGVMYDPNDQVIEFAYRQSVRNNDESIE